MTMSRVFDLIDELDLPPGVAQCSTACFVN